MASQNQFISLKEYQPLGAPKPEIFEIVDTATPDAPKAGQFIFRVKYVSADPYMSFRVRQAGGEGEFAGFHLGKPINGFIVGVVEEANECSTVKKGDILSGMGDYQKVQLLSEDKHMLHVANGVSDDHLSYLIGVLGMTGCTAWAGVTRVLECKKDKVLFVSGAAGAVGSAVGQLGRVLGLTVIGSAGSKEKCDRLKEHGFTHAFNYKDCKSAKDVEEKLREFSGEGIDYYFDNVGGDQLQGAIAALKHKGRIAICGQITQYGAAEQEKVANCASTLLFKCARIEGFMVFEWLGSESERSLFYKEMAGWVKEGKMQADETEFAFEKFGEAMGALFTGGNLGKVVVKA